MSFVFLVDERRDSESEIYWYKTTHIMKCPLLMLIIENPFEFLAEQERKYFQLRNGCKTVFTIKKQMDNHRTLL